MKPDTLREAIGAARQFAAAGDLLLKHTGPQEAMMMQSEAMYLRGLLNVLIAERIEEPASK